MSNNEKFKNLFKKLEESITLRIKSIKYDNFYSLLEKCKTDSLMSKILNEHLNFIKEIANLRNILQHSSNNICEVSLETISKLETILKRIENPLTILNVKGIVLAKGVIVAHPGDLVSKVLKEMTARNISQVPIVDNQKIVGILTLRAIANWIAQEPYSDSLFDFENKFVKNVMNLHNKEDKFLVVARNKLSVEVWDLFKSYSENGSNLDAVIITHSGSINESILGIVTSSDVPYLIEG